MDIQRLRNLTTGILHTEMGHIYKDLEEITGEKGLLTSMLPRVLDAVKPWLLEHVTEPKFWDGKYDPTHTGKYKLPQSTKNEQRAIFERFKEISNR